MPGAKIKVEVKARGPMTNQLGTIMLRNTTDDIEDEVGERANLLIHQRLQRVLQNPTGRFEATVMAVRSSGDVVVDGEGTIYGRWLEGVSTRNASTRFKGYATFRRTSQVVDKDAKPIADRQLDRLARRL
jgi:hypothetical protein